jgi:hypothetical protein
MGATTYAGKRPKRLKWARRIVIALAVYTVVGFFIIPAIIKSQMLKRLPGLTHRAAAIEQVKFNPFALSLTIRGFSLKETNGDVFSSFDEFYANFQPIASLFRWNWVFSGISLQKPFAQITYREDGTFNFANLLGTNAAAAAPSTPKTPAGPPRLTIYSLSISNGAVGFADLKRKEPFRTEFIPIDINLTNLTTIRDRNSPYSFIARTDTGEVFAWSGTITANPPGSSGIFRLGGLQLPKYSTYAHDFARYQIEGGLLDIAAIYHYDSSTNALDLTVSNAAVALTHLRLKSPDTGETNIDIPAFKISGTDASVARRTAHIGRIESSGGSLLVRREADGTINLLDLLNLPPAPPAESAATNTPPSAETSGWNARIDEIAFDNYSFTIQDKDLLHPAAFTIDQFNFDLKGVSNASNAPVTASLSLRFAGTGTISVNGTATLMPPSADMQIALTNVDLRPIQPYVEEQARVAIADGTVDVRGRARYAPPEPGAPLVSFTGDVAVDKFAMVDDVLYKDFAKWDALNVDGIKLALLPTSLELKRVKFVRLINTVVMGPDRRPTFLALLRQKPGATNSATNEVAPAPAPVAPQPIFPISLGECLLDDCSIAYVDDYIEPHCSFGVQQFSGSISNISSDEKTTADVNLTGQVDARAPFSITGKVNPFATNLDMTVVFTNTELTPLSTYSEKYVGRPLSKGKLAFAVHYLIDHGDLKSENNFYVNQLMLGAKNDSPDATHLPVKLAINLIKDRNGLIELHIPVTGRVDDPKFRVGPVIWQVVKNMLEKAATSPFSLLGAAFGGGDELSFVSFVPGQFALPDSETNKLEILAKALFAHPALTLEITGSVNPNFDRLPLAHLRLEKQLKSLWVQEQQEAGKPAVTLDQVNLDPDERERLVRKIYKTQIGPYQPSAVDTNQASGPGSINSETARIAALLAALPPKARVEHGAILLRKKKSNASETTGNSAGGLATATAPAAPLTREQVELEDMEAQLAQRIDITGDDFHELMQKRADEVQAYLLKTGKIAGERLFVIAPKKVDASFRGDDRVNLSLD